MKQPETIIEAEKRVAVGSTDGLDALERAYEKANREWLDCRQKIAILKEQERELERLKNEAYGKYRTAMRSI